MEIKGLYTKRGWFYYQPPTNGGKRPPAIALKTKVEDAAVDRVYRLFKADALGVQSKESMSVMLADYLAAMLASREHTPKTSHCTKTTLEALTKWWGDPRVSTITRERVEGWRADLQERPGMAKGSKMSEASITSYLLRLRGFLSWLVSEGHLRENPMEKIALGRVKKTRREKFLTTTQRDRLLEDPPNDEVAFILYFGFFAGLRFEEMLAMEPRWIEKSKDGLVLHVQKTAFWQPKDKELRTIVMHPRLVAFVNSYGLRHPFMLKPDKKVWKASPAYRYNPKKAFKAHMKAHGVEWASYHTTRHSFATHMAMAGAPMIEIADALGDGLRVTEETYVAFSPASRRTITAI